MVNITIGQFIPGNSMLHRLDPRIKIIIVMAFVLALFFINHVKGYALLVGCTFVAVSLSKIPLITVLRGLKPLWWIVLFTLCIHFFFTPGTVVWQWKSLALTREGITQGVLMSVRLIVLILVSSLLTLTTSPINLTDGIERLLSVLRPLGVPAHEIAMMMTIALRFIPTLAEEADKIIKAQTARGADFSSGSIIVRATNLSAIMVPLFISAFRRADELALAMESRCYRGGQGRTRMRELRIRAVDVAALSLACGLLMVAVMWR